MGGGLYRSLPPSRYHLKCQFRVRRFVAISDASPKLKMKNGIIVFVEIVFNDFYFKMLASFPSRLVEHTLSLSIVRDFFVKNNERMKECTNNKNKYF